MRAQGTVPASDLKGLKRQLSVFAPNDSPCVLRPGFWSFASRVSSQKKTVGWLILDRGTPDVIVDGKSVNARTPRRPNFPQSLTPPAFEFPISLLGQICHNRRDTLAPASLNPIVNSHEGAESAQILPIAN
ncbi:MAG: hypothetical protein ACI97A_000619 [Planctomycetota bacterium]|jgi:hypothetical protein